MENLIECPPIPVFTPLCCLGFISLILKIGCFYENNFFLTEGNCGMTAEGGCWRELRCVSTLLVLKFDSSFLKKWSVVSLMATPFLFGTNPPVSCHFTLREGKMPMSRWSLDLIIVSLPKHHKENRKIVNVRTEVAGAISKLCCLKEIFY